jgi:hypothetical protein
VPALEGNLVHGLGLAGQDVPGHHFASLVPLIAMSPGMFSMQKAQKFAFSG